MKSIDGAPVLMYRFSVLSETCSRAKKSSQLIRAVSEQLITQFSKQDVDAFVRLLFVRDLERAKKRVTCRFNPIHTGEPD